MNRSRLLLVVCITITFATALLAFRVSSPKATRVGTVAPAASMLEPRSGHSATLLPDGKVLIVGGMRRNQDFYKSAELFDPATGKFKQTGEMNETARGAHRCPAAVGKSTGRGRLGRHGRYGFGRALRPTYRQIHDDRENDHPTRPAKCHTPEQWRCAHRWR